MEQGFGAGEMGNVMQDDMRLKRVIAKGPGASKILDEFPCRKCEDLRNGQCDHQCDELKKFITDNNTSLVHSSTIEVEWMYVPSFKSAAFWMKLPFPIGVLLLVVGCILLYVIKGCREGGRTDSIKVSLSGNGYQIERYVESVQDFEKGTNDLDRIAIELQALKRSVKQ